METVATAGLLSVAVAALGLLATALFRLDGRMEAGFARQEARTDARFAQVDGRFDRLESRMDAGFAAVVARMDQLDARLTEHLRNHG